MLDTIARRTALLLSALVLAATSACSTSRLNGDTPVAKTKLPNGGDQLQTPVVSSAPTSSPTPGAVDGDDDDDDDDDGVTDGEGDVNVVPTPLPPETTDDGAVSCPDQTVLTGFDEAGDAECTPLPKLACAADEYLASADFAKAKPVCVKLSTRIYTRSAAIVRSTNPSQPNLYLGSASCDPGDFALSGAGRCAASDYGITGSFAAVSATGEPPADGPLAATTWRHNCVLTNGIGTNAFVQVFCLKNQ